MGEERLRDLSRRRKESPFKTVADMEEKALKSQEDLEQVSLSKLGFSLLKEMYYTKMAKR